MPFVGETLPLSFQLLDADDSKFCRASLLSPSGTPLASSPVNLTNIGGGKYTSDSVVMPNEDYVEVTYQSFDDAGYSVVSESHLVGTDVFRLEVPDSVILAKLDQIISKLDGIALPGASINARIVQNQINEVVRDARQAKALLERKDVKSMIKSDDTLTKIASNKIKAKVEE